MRALTNIIIVIVLITPIVHPKQYAIAFCECCAAKKKSTAEPNKAEANKSKTNKPHQIKAKQQRTAKA